MALYRTISIGFWTDSKVTDEFTPEDKLFYLYLFTNPHTNLAGCYEVSHKQMAFEIGYSIDSIRALIDRFEKVYNVIRYSENTKEVLLINWHKYNWTSSEKFRKPLEKEINKVKQPDFKDYLLRIFGGEEVYPIDTVSKKTTYPIDTPNTNTNTNTNKEKEDVSEVLNLYHDLCPSLPRVRKLTNARKNKIRSRIKSLGIYSIREAFIKVESSDFLTGRNSEWRADLDWLMKNDENMLKVLEGRYDNRSRSTGNPFLDMLKEGVVE